MTTTFDNAPARADGATPTQTVSADYGIALLRVTLGAMFVAHGAIKYLVFTPAGTAQFFESLGLPGALGYATIAAELFGGIALIVGFKTRLVTAALLPILVGALVFGHLTTGFLFSNPGGGWEYPAFLIAVSVSLLLTGGGAASIDRAQTETV